MTEMIDKTVKSLLKDGFKPWGRVIPDPRDAPKGSQLFQFRRKHRGRNEDASVVLTAEGKFVRGGVASRSGYAVLEAKE